MAAWNSHFESHLRYLDRGIPYRRGYLLHGPPGCGKRFARDVALRIGPLR